MPMASEETASTGRKAIFTREPQGPKTAASKGSLGDQALMDAVAIIVVCWVLLFLLTFSLRRHNV